MNKLRVKRLIVLVFACLMGMQSVLGYAFTSATQGGTGQQSEVSTTPPCHMAAVASTAEETVNSPQQCCADGSLCKILCATPAIAYVANPHGLNVLLEYPQPRSINSLFVKPVFISFIPETSLRPPINLL